MKQNEWMIKQNFWDSTAICLQGQQTSTTTTEERPENEIKDARRWRRDVCHALSNVSSIFGEMSKSISHLIERKPRERKERQVGP